MQPIYDSFNIEATIQNLAQRPIPIQIYSSPMYGCICIRICIVWIYRIGLNPKKQIHKTFFYDVLVILQLYAWRSRATFSFSKNKLYKNKNKVYNTKIYRWSAWRSRERADSYRWFYNCFFSSLATVAASVLELYGSGTSSMWWWSWLLLYTGCVLSPIWPERISN